MNNIQLSNLIRFPEAFKEVSINELRSFLAKHPYCQTIHMLLLKKMHSKKANNFRVQLAFSAIFICDRNVLYHLINNDRFSSTGLNNSFTKTEKEERLKQPASVASTVTTKTQTEKKEVAQELKEGISVETLKQQQISAEPSSDTEPAKVKEKGAVKIDTSISDETKEIETKEEKVVSDEAGGDSNDIIEQFIKEEPRIVPKEDDFRHAEEFAESSNVMSFEDLVTETLANVYLDQGNKNRAIKILEKLSLTIPEKSSYFAVRIKEIKKDPKNKQ